MDVENTISEFLKRSEFDCAAVAERDGRHVIRLGQFLDEECIAALVRDFYDPRTVAALGKYLEGMLLPQTKVHGRHVIGVSGFLPDRRIVVLYRRDERDAVERHKRTKRLWQELMQELEGTG